MFYVYVIHDSGKITEEEYDMSFIAHESADGYARLIDKPVYYRSGIYVVSAVGRYNGNVQGIA